MDLLLTIGFCSFFCNRQKKTNAKNAWTAKCQPYQNWYFGSFII